MRRIRALLLAPLLVTAVAPASVRARPRCERAVSKALSTCVQRLAKRSLACWSQTGAACPDGDARTTSTLASLERTIRSACPDASTVHAAAYPPLFDPTTLVRRMQVACTDAIATVDARTLGGPHGAVLSAASALDRHCLLEANTEAAALLKKTLRVQGRCVTTERGGRPCDVTRADDRITRFAETMTRKVTAACPDLSALVALTPDQLVARTQAQSACLLASAHATTDPFPPTCGPRPEAAPPARGTWTRVVLDESTWGTRCGDGSPYAFWIRLAPTGAALEHVLVNLAGGGACVNGAQCAGVSASLFRAIDDVQPSGGHLSTSDSVNPFFDWTMLHLPYCTQDLHVGGGTTNVFAADGVTVERYGAVNVHAALSYLRDVLWTLLDAEDSDGFRPDRLRVLFAGESAGAFGVQYLYHHLLDELRWTHTTAVPDSGLALNNGQVGGVLGLSLVMVSESSTGWHSRPFLPPYCHGGPCAIGPVLQARSSLRLGTVPEQMFLNVSNQVDDTQQVTTLFPSRASWVNELRASYCGNQGLPGVRYFLPARTTSTHTLLRSNTFMTSLTAGGVVMGDWLAGAVSDPLATPDRADEGTLVSAIPGVQPFPCSPPD